MEPSDLSAAKRALLTQRALAGEAIHEISNVLNTFTMNSSALHEEVQERRPHVELEELTAMLEQASNRMRELMELIRRTVPALPYEEREEVNLAQLLSDLGVVVHSTVAEPVIVEHRGAITYALEAIAGFIGPDVTADLRVRRSVGPLGEEELLTLQLCTPGRPADVASMRRAMSRHFKGGAEERGGDLGLSVPGAILHVAQAEARVPGGVNWAYGQEAADDLWIQIEFGAR